MCLKYIVQITAVQIKDINKIKIGQKINISKKPDQNEQMRSYYAQQNAKLGLNPKQHVIYETPNQKIGLGQYIVPEYINNEPVQDKTFTNYNQNQTPIFNPLLPDFSNLSKVKTKYNNNRITYHCYHIK